MNPVTTTQTLAPAMSTVAIALAQAVAPVSSPPAPARPAHDDEVLTHLRTLARCVQPGRWLDVRVLGVDPFAVHRVLREEGLARAHTWVEIDLVGADPGAQVTVLRVTAVRPVAD